MFDKNKFAEVIKNIKESYHSQEEFSKKSGIGRTYLSQYMNRKLHKPPTPRILKKLCENSNGLVSYDELMSICGYIDKDSKTTHKISHQKVGFLEHIYNNPQDLFYMCPVYTQIRAGANWAKQNIVGRIPIPMTGEIENPEEYFYFKITGESMNKIVKNGAYALIHKQDMVEDGEIAVVFVDNYDATLKKFSKQSNFIILEPMSDVTKDPNIKTQVYDKKASIQILGKYIGKFEMN